MDTAKYTPVFNYKVFTKDLNTDFTLLPIEAAKMIGEPLLDLKTSILKLGLGNYKSTEGEFSIHNLRSKKVSYGLNYNHNSSFGKIKLDNNKKVYAPFVDNSLNLYGKIFFSKNILGINFDYGKYDYKYYGMPLPHRIKGENLNLPLKNNNEFFLGSQSKKNIGAEVQLKSFNVSSNDLNYDVSVGYKSFSDKYDIKDNSFLVKYKFLKNIENNFWGATGKLEFHKVKNINYYSNGMKFDNYNVNLLTFNPYWYNKGENYNFHLGFNISALTGDNSGFKIAPNINANLTLVDRILYIFANVTGGYNLNNYAQVIEENQYLANKTIVKPDYTKVMVDGGFRGYITKKTTFKLSAAFKITEDQHFFKNKQVSLIPQSSYTNQFDVVYDDVKTSKFSGEISFREIRNTDLIIRTNIYNYSTDKIAKAWYKNKFDVSVAGKYELKDNIRIGAEIFFAGKRSYLDTDGTEKSLDALFDLNFNAVYDINRTFSAYAKIDNLLANDNKLWNGYSTQGLKVIIGTTLTF